jgi:HAD superfamily hydrolase (TIGR01509 family)
MRYHIVAWHRILNDFGANLTIDQVKKECYGKNNELLDRIFPGKFSREKKDAMSLDKEREYQRAFRSELKLISGLEGFLDKARSQNIRMGIGTAAIMFNVDFVLDGLDIRHYFESIVSADDVTHSKPDPETWTRCAEKLNKSPEQCLVFEDSPKGVEAAHRAEMDCVVITTTHKREEFSPFGNVVSVIDNFTGIGNQLFH